MDDFKHALLGTQETVNVFLQDYFADLEGVPEQLFEAMKYGALAPGKRFRAFLHFTVGKLFDVPQPQLTPVAAAIELVHCYSLIHDDLPCMDNASVRRGVPTVHLQFNDATAVLAGTALLSEGFKIIGQHHGVGDPELRCALMTGLADALGPKGMMGGQQLDIESEGATLSQEQICHLENLKTGALIEYSCVSAALIGKATAKDIERIKLYSRSISLAYQMTDDLLDIEGNTFDTGKSHGLDQKADKCTMISILGIQRTRDMAQSLITDALNQLEPYGDNANLLRQAVQFILERTG